MSFWKKIVFYLDYFFSKTIRIWWEVKDIPARVFICEMIYSFGKIFHYYTDFTSALFNVKGYRTRFGQFNIRPNTMDIVSASPAFERPDLNYLEYLLAREIERKQHVTFIDVGADFGAYTITVANFLKRRCDKDSFDIYSFEPTRSSFDYLNKNISENLLNNQEIRTFNVALGEQDISEVDIFFNEEDPGSTSIKKLERHSRIISRQRKETISVCKLDTMVNLGKIQMRSGCLFMKVDVEGYETEVLRGAMESLKNDIFSEVFLMVEDSIDSSIKDYLASEGFTFLNKNTPYNSWWHYQVKKHYPDEYLASVIIVNWNGKKWLRQCLDSLRKQTVKNFEIILVDNASQDDSVAFLKENYPEVKIVQSGTNLGFAGGNNLGVKSARGKYLILLNNDTWVESDYVEKFTKAFDEIPNLGAAQSKIVLMDDPEKLDACGAFWSHSSYLYHYGYSKQGQEVRYNRNRRIFSTKGASMLVRREVIEKIGLFDEDFWCYYEETDFCHRLWIGGYECWYYPQTLIHHAIGGTSRDFKNSYIQFHNLKNKLKSYLKNLEISSLYKVLPLFLLLNTGLSLFLLMKGNRTQISAFVKAFTWNMKHFQTTMEERTEIQNSRVYSDEKIFSLVRKEPELSYYYHLFFDLENYRDRE